MAQHSDTRTIHTIYIDVEDQILSKLEVGDQVEVILQSRQGSTLPKKLSYRDIDFLIGDTTRRRPSLK